MQIMQSRRDFLASTSLAPAAGVLGARASLADEGPPETTTIRLPRDPNICTAPGYIADDQLFSPPVVCGAVAASPNLRTGSDERWPPEATPDRRPNTAARPQTPEVTNIGKAASLANNSSANPENTLYATVYRCLPPPKPSS